MMAGASGAWERGKRRSGGHARANCIGGISIIQGQGELSPHTFPHTSLHTSPPPPLQDVSIAQDYSDLLALMLPTSLTYLHITNACHLMMYNAITSRCGEAGLAGQCRICVLGAGLHPVTVSGVYRAIEAGGAGAEHIATNGSILLAARPLG